MTGKEEESTEGGLGVSSAREELREIDRHQICWQILRLKFIGGERKELVGLRLQDREDEGMEIGGVPGHDSIFTIS